MITDLNESCGGRSVSQLCACMDITRQGYYFQRDMESELDILRTSIVLYCLFVRKHLMPRAGMAILYAMCKEYFGDKMKIGRDQCYDIFRANGLTLRTLKKPRTTNSNHNFYIYPDLLNTSPKLVATRFGELVVADITYVPTEDGWAYLALLTDAATRMVVGYKLYPTLETAGPMAALEMALDFYRENGVDLSQLIHHSDRGIQYCSNLYVNRLKELGIQISMTQTGDPLHNALAERMNNTIKNGWLFECDDKPFEEVEEAVAKAIAVYNNIRPHQALGMKAPAKALEEMLQ